MRIGIVGGGVAGLTAGYRLAQAGHQVQVFEAAPELGGQAGTFAVGGNRLEHFYHHFFPSDSAAIALIEEMGLADRLTWQPSKSGYFYQGHAYGTDTALDLLRFRALPLWSRFVMGLHYLYLTFFGDWRKLEKVTAYEWTHKWGTKTLYDRFWGALLRGKFGSLEDQISMAWLSFKIQVRRAQNNGGLKEELGYLHGSVQPLFERLAESIITAGGQVHRGAPVTRVHSADGVCTGLNYQQDGEEHTEPFDAVILTVASRLALELAPDLSGEYAALLDSLRYQGAVTMALELDRQMTDNYWLAIADETMPMVVTVEHTNFISPQEYGGSHILYLGNYVDGDSDYFRLSKEEILERYLPSLRKLNPAFERSWIKDYWVFRDPYGQPVIETNYSQRIPSHRTPIEGLYLANTSQIYPEDRGVNYSVRLGEAVSTIVQGGDARASVRW